MSSSLPAHVELLAQAQWMGWKYKDVEGKAKPTKAPVDPRTGRFANSNTNPQLQVSGLEATLNQEMLGFDGIGWACSKQDDYTFGDLDNCILPDGTLTPYAQHIVALMDTYFELSPSGTGLRFIVRGKLGSNLGADPEGDGACRLELKESGGFMTFTGNHWPGSRDTIEERETELDIIATEARTRRKAAKATPNRDIVTISNYTRTAGDTPYGLTALHTECQELATTPEGGRNTRLNLAAYRLGQLVAGGELTRSTAEQELLAATRRCDLGDSEAAATLKSGLDAGELQPRECPKLQLATWDVPDTDNEPDDLEALTLEQAKAIIRSLRKEQQWHHEMKANPNLKMAQRAMIEHFRELERTARPKIINGQRWFRIDTEAVGKAIGGDKGTVSRNLPALKAGGVIALREEPYTSPNGYKTHLLFFHLTGAERSPAAIDLPNKGRNTKQCVDCGHELTVKHRWTGRQEVVICPHCQTRHVFPVETRAELPVGKICFAAPDPEQDSQVASCNLELAEEEETQDAPTLQPMVSNVAALSLVEDTQTSQLQVAPGDIPRCQIAGCQAQYNGYLEGKWLCATHYDAVVFQQKWDRVGAPP